MNRREFLKGAFAVAALAPLASLLAKTGASASLQAGTKGMSYRTLGRTGFRTSAIGMGVEGFQRKRRGEVRELLQYAVDKGVNFLDVCVLDPELVSGFGDVIRKNRDGFVLQTHLGTVWENSQYRRTRNVSEIRDAFRAALQGFGTDHVEVGMIHYVDEPGDWNHVLRGDLMRYARVLKEKGTIRSIGLSTHSVDIARRAVESGFVDVLMFSINLSYDASVSGGTLTLDRERQALHELCEREGIGLDAMKAYAGGNLLTANSPFGAAFTPVQCLHYVLTRPGVASAMVGCSSPEEIDAALAWNSASSEERDYSKVLAKAGESTWTGYCLYCGHCAPCPKEIDIASVNKLLNLALAQKEVPDTVRDHYAVLKRHASDCIQCGACEKRCPFGAPVREKMKQAARVFGV